MLYYSKGARDSVIREIKDCIETIGQISGKELAYSKARATTKYLSMLIDIIENESKLDEE